MILQSPPVWWSGLKAKSLVDIDVAEQSPPVWWSGLKEFQSIFCPQSGQVSTCVVEWIESLI